RPHETRTALVCRSNGGGDMARSDQIAVRRDIPRETYPFRGRACVTRAFGSGKGDTTLRLAELQALRRVLRLARGLCGVPQDAPLVSCPTTAGKTPTPPRRPSPAHTGDRLRCTSPERCRSSRYGRAREARATASPAAQGQQDSRTRRWRTADPQWLSANRCH